MKILLIDDNEEIRLGLRELLVLSGHTVTTASNGREGVQLAADRPDLIICDVDMPEMNGYEAIAAIQQLPQCQDIPFIFLSGRLDREDRRKGMTLGADDFLTKPFDARELLDAIAARVRRQRPLRDRIDQLSDTWRREAAADWSHELMTPLNAVLGGLDLIESEADTIKPAELKELLALIRQGAERQQHLSRKLICFFGLERMNATAATAAAGSIDFAIAAASRVAQAEGRTADLRTDCAPARVALGDELLANATAELVENACHFSAIGRPIEVRGHVSDGIYHLEVTDQGPGMTPPQRAGIGAFVQFGRERREQQGLGLGLAIARGMVASVGGRLRLEDGPGGTGLKAVLEIPLAPGA